MCFCIPLEFFPCWKVRVFTILFERKIEELDITTYWSYFSRNEGKKLKKLPLQGIDDQYVFLDQTENQTRQNINVYVRLWIVVNCIL